jgi:hypothetical protein
VKSSYSIVSRFQLGSSSTASALQLGQISEIDIAKPQALLPICSMGAPIRCSGTQRVGIFAGRALFAAQLDSRGALSQPRPAGAGMATRRLPAC